MSKADAGSGLREPLAGLNRLPGASLPVGAGTEVPTRAVLVGTLTPKPLLSLPASRVSPDPCLRTLTCGCAARPVPVLTRRVPHCRPTSLAPSSGHCLFCGPPLDPILWVQGAERPFKASHPLCAAAWPEPPLHAGTAGVCPAAASVLPLDTASGLCSCPPSAPGHLLAPWASCFRCAPAAPLDATLPLGEPHRTPACPWAPISLSPGHALRTPDSG